MEDQSHDKKMTLDDALRYSYGIACAFSAYDKVANRNDITMIKSKYEKNEKGEFKPEPIVTMVYGAQQEENQQPEIAGEDSDQSDPTS